MKGALPMLLAAVLVLGELLWARVASGPASAPSTPDPNLPRALLIGDSISMGYTEPTRALLSGKVNVYRIPENGGPTTNGLARIEKWLGQGKWDVIHFNWGLHDVKIVDGKYHVPLEDYRKNLGTLVARLKKTGAKLIWASTTPVPEGALSPARKKGDEVAYNAAARKIMEDNDIPIDDLYEAAATKLSEIQMPANVHFTKAGYEFLAKHVAASVLKALGRPADAASQPASRPAGS